MFIAVAPPRSVVVGNCPRRKWFEAVVHRPEHVLVCAAENPSVTPICRPSRGVQFITFTTAGDCSACHEHLAGLDSLDASGQLRVEHIYVSFSPPSQRESDRRAYRTVVRSTVCWDGTGYFWDKYGIAHT